MFPFATEGILSRGTGIVHRYNAANKTDALLGTSIEESARASERFIRYPEELGQCRQRGVSENRTGENEVRTKGRPLSTMGYESGGTKKSHSSEQRPAVCSSERRTKERE